MTFLISALVAFLVITLGAGAYGVKSRKKPYKPYKTQSNIEEDTDYDFSGVDVPTAIEEFVN